MIVVFSFNEIRYLLDAVVNCLVLLFDYFQQVILFLVTLLLVYQTLSKELEMGNEAVIINTFLIKFDFEKISNAQSEADILETRLAVSGSDFRISQPLNCIFPRLEGCAARVQTVGDGPLLVTYDVGADIFRNT